MVDVLTSPRGKPYARELRVEQLRPPADTGGRVIDCCERAPGERGCDRMLRAGEAARDEGARGDSIEAKSEHRGGGSGTRQRGAQVYLDQPGGGCALTRISTVPTKQA